MSEVKTLKEALTPAFLTEVLPNTLLKQILTDTVTQRGDAGDLDQRTVAGVYYVHSACLNVPAGALRHGVLLVGQANSAIGIQIYFDSSVSRNSGTLYMRIRWSEKWEPWYCLNMTKVESAA